MSDYEYWSPEKIVGSGVYSLTMGQLRHLLLHRHKNQLEHAVRRVGKRILLRKDLFDAWIELQVKKGGNGG